MTEKNYYTMDNKELRKLIVEDLKEIGIHRKTYSLKVKNYSFDKGIDILIKSPNINITDVGKVLEKYRHVDYCKVTYETLQGCNVYVNASYDYDVFDSVVNENLELAKNSIEGVHKLDNGYGYKVFENEVKTMYLFREDEKVTVSLNDNVNHSNKRLIVNGVEWLSVNIFKALNHGFIS